MKFSTLITLLLLPLALSAQVSVQKQQGTNALTNGSIVVPSGVSITANGGQIIATNTTGNTSGNQVLAGNGNGGFQNVTIGTGLTFTGNTLSSVSSGGTVTSVSVTGANGITGTVANPTTTPAISLTLGAITPTTINGNTISTGTGTLNLGSYTLTLAQSGTLGSAAYTATTAYDPAGSAAAVSANSLQKANNLSDLTSASTARTNLGLGTVATQTAPSGTTSQLLANNGTGGFSNVTVGSGLSFSGGTLSSTAAGGTVTSFSSGSLTPLFTTSVATSTTTPALSFTLSSAANNTLLSNVSGSSAAPQYNTLSTVMDSAIGSTQGSIIYRSGTAWSQLTPGTSGQVLTTQGAGANPTWSNASSGTVTSVSVVTANGVSATVANSTTTPALTFTLGNITPLSDTSVFNGSIGQTTPNAGAFNSLKTTTLTGYLYGNSTSNVTASTTIPTTALSGTVTNAQLANSSITIAGTTTSLGGSITQDTITGLSSTGIVKRTGANTLATAVSGTDYAPATSGSSILYGNGSGGFSNVTVGSGLTFSGGTLTSTGSGGTVTSVSGTGSVNGITLTGTVTSSGSLTLGGTLSGVSLTSQVSGTLPIANGGTGVTTSSGANSVVLRDSNSNVFGNNFFKNFLSQAASGTTITLTASSSPDMVITGSGGQVIKLPDATTLPNGNIFTFNNNQSSGTITVQNNSGTTIATLQSGAFIDVVLLSNATSAGSWDYHNVAPSNASWSTNTLSWAGSYTNGTWNGNTIGVGYGGTGATTLTGYVYGNGTSAMTASTTIPTSALSGTISNAQLTNSAITIAGTSTSLGGSISQDTITGLSTTGLVKRTGANTLAIAASGTDYAPATSGSSLLYGNGSGGFSNVTIGTGVSFSGGTLSATGTGGTVTQFTAGNLSPLFSTSVATNTTTPALSFSLSNAAANTILGNNTSSSAAPAYNTVSSYLDNAFSSTQGAILYRSGSAWVALPAGTSGQLLTTGGAGANPSWTTYTGSSSITTVGTLTSGAIGTGFTAIPNSALANSSITFGSTSQALGSTISAINGVSIGGSSAAAGTFTSLTATGTTTLATSLTGALSASSGVVSAGTLTVANGGTGATTKPLANQGLTPATSTVTSGASPSINWALSNSFDLTLTSATAATLTFSNAVDGQTITIAIHQPASGTATTVTWPTMKWSGGTAPTQTATLGKTDIYTIYYNATAGVYYGSYVQNF